MKMNPLNLALLGLLCFGVLASRADTIVWTNTAGGSFGTAANWSPNSVPGSGDVAVITNAGTYTVTLDTGRTVGGIQVGGNGGGTQALTMNGNPLTLVGSGTVNSNGIFVISGDITVSSISFINNGTVTWTAGTVSGGNNSIYNNGLWDVQGDNVLVWVVNFPPNFFNAGTFRKSAGTGTTTFSGVTLYNRGLLEVQSGTVNIGYSGENTAPGVFHTTNGATLLFSDGYTFNTGTQFTGNGTNLLSGGSFGMHGNIQFTTLKQTGGTLGGNHGFSGLFTFAGGLWNTAGSTTISNGSTLVITTNMNLYASRTLANNGTVAWVNGAIEGGNCVIINNGLWDAQGDNAVSWIGGFPPNYYNNGTFRKSAATGMTGFHGTYFYNRGLLEVQSGTVNIGYSGENTAPGVFHTTNGATLLFSDGYTFNTGTQFTGNGTNLLSGGSFGMHGNIQFTTLKQTGGTLGGNHGFSGLFTFAGGLWNTAGSTTISNGSTLVITTNLSVASRTLINNGTVTWTAGTVSGGNNSTYNNGLWDAQGDNYFEWVVNFPPNFFNNGTFRKSAGTGTTAFYGTDFYNSGLLEVQSGTASLAYNHTLTGGTVKIGINSLTNYGKVSLSGSAGLAGTFAAVLNGGYVPITNNSFAVITYGSLSGLFTNFSLPFADAWTTNYSPTTFSLYVLNARPIPPVFATNQVVNELTELIVTNTAVDLDVPTNTLTYMLLAPPAGAAISSDGIFTWTPSEAQGPGTNVITSVVTDNGVPALSATNSFTVVVQEINVPPVLSPLANTNVNELTTLTLTNSATDSDIPVNTLTYELIEAPSGAVIDTNGVITWTPTETQGPGTNTFITVVTDYNPDAVNEQQLTVTNTFEVVVNEVNIPPVLFVPANNNIAELTNYSALASATDEDIPANTLTFSLVSGPAGLTVTPTGAINWTPTEAQGPSTNSVLIIVMDANPTGVNATSLSVTGSFELVVHEVNVPPVLTLPANTNINEMVAFTTSATASDSDDPTNALTFALVSGPAGLTVSPDGLVNWTPTEDQGPGTNTIAIRVTDTNAIAVNATSLSVTSSFQIIVGEVNVAPVLGALTDRTVNPGQTISFTATATDADLPTNSLSYALVSPPSGADITSDGQFTWRAPAALANTTNVIQVRVQDNGTPGLNDVKAFTVIVDSLGAPVVLTPVSYLNGQFRFQISGPAGPDYVTEASTNLSDWIRVETNQSPTLPFEFNDPAAGVFGGRVYRVRLQP